MNLDTMDALGIDVKMARALVAISTEPHALSDVAAHLRVASAAVTDIADRLEKKGLARRVRLPQDRRVIHLVITDEGTRTLS